MSNKASFGDLPIVFTFSEYPINSYSLQDIMSDRSGKWETQYNPLSQSLSIKSNRDLGKVTLKNTQEGQKQDFYPVRHFVQAKQLRSTYQRCSPKDENSKERLADQKISYTLNYKFIPKKINLNDLSSDIALQIILPKDSPLTSENDDE